MSLRNVRLWRLDIEQGFDVPSEGRWDVEVAINAGQRIDGRTLVVEVTYTVAADMTAEAEAPRGYRITTNWLIYYELSSTDELDRQDLDSFAIVSGTFAAHPYERELVQRLTGQMGFEPLVLNVLQSPTEIRAGEDFEMGVTSDTPSDHTNDPAAMTPS